MNRISEGLFLDHFGYISRYERHVPIDQLYLRQRAFLDCVSRGITRSRMLFFDRQNNPYVSTYKNYVQSQQSFMGRLSAEQESYSGEDVLAAIHRAWSERWLVAKDACTWEEGDIYSLQTIRDRVRRLQIIESERKLLQEALQGEEEAREVFVKQLSIASRVKLLALLALEKIFFYRENTVPIENTLSQLPCSSVEFSDEHSFVLWTPFCLRKEDRNWSSCSFQLCAKVLREPILKGPFAEKRFVTRFECVDVQDGGVATIEFMRNRECLTGVVSGDHRVWLSISEAILLEDYAKEMYVYDKSQWSRDYVIEKVMSPEGTCLRVSLHGSFVSMSKPVKVPYVGEDPVLPRGNDLPPERMQILIREERGQLYSSLTYSTIRRCEEVPSKSLYLV